MIKLVHATEQVARKEYECNACLWIKDNPDEAFEGITFADRRILVKYLRHQNGRILKGQRYSRLTHSIDGEMFTICVHTEVNRIAEEYDLYPVGMD